jgi:hypothetical protein
MKLADLRKLSIRKNLKIRFKLPNGLECVITEQGTAQVPALQRVPDFNLEQELGSISDFVLESVSADKKSAPKPQLVSREELTLMVSTSSSGAAAEHEDE